MARVIELKTPEGKHGGWMIHCPACGCGHLFDDRWTFNGNMDKPTFRASMLVYEHPYGDGVRPRCHSFVTDGRIEYCSDSGHELAGQIVELPDWNELRDAECISCTECIKADICKNRERSPSVIGCIKGERQTISVTDIDT